MKSQSSARLILFDIDGTLISTDGLARKTFAEVLEQVYQVESPALTHDFAGKTDLQIVYEIMTLAGLTEIRIQERLDDLFENIFYLLQSKLTKETVRIHEGVFDALNAISKRDDCTLGILTGNMKRGAELKLAPHGLNKYFSIGAYGDESRYRNELPAIARSRAESLTGFRYVGKNIVIIGDTPHDISCGAHLGVRTIAVATGGTSYDELKKHNPDFLFDSLANTHEVLTSILQE